MLALAGSATTMPAPRSGLHMGLTQGLLAALVAAAATAGGTAFGVFNLVCGVALPVASGLAGGVEYVAGRHVYASAGLTAVALVVRCRRRRRQAGDGRVRSRYPRTTSDQGRALGRS